MPSPIRDYETHGDADTSRARGAAVADLVIGALVTLLAWPFPVLRAVFGGVAGSDARGWAIHVPALLLGMVVVAWVCSALSIAFGRRTVGMYFADLGFEAAPAPPVAFALSLPWTLAGLAGMVGARSPAAGFARERLRSTLSGG